MSTSHPFDSHTSSVTEDAEHLAARYDELRQQLVRLQSAPVKDMAAIEMVMHLLDRTHMAYRAANGVVGSGPLG
jgi:hypothetical protein